MKHTKVGCSSAHGDPVRAARAAERARRTGVMYGALIAGLGVLFLLAQLDMLEISDAVHWWPLLVAGYGLSRILVWNSADDVGSGVSWILLTGWFLVSRNEWFGLDWGSSWPMVLIAIGGGMVTTALLRPAFRSATMASAPPRNGDSVHA